jgi:hypothetical protein
MTEHTANIERFKQNFSEIILKFDSTLYDDEYMTILASKTNKIVLKNNVLETTMLDYQYADRNVLNSFETTMTNHWSEYGTLLLLGKKIIIDFIIKSRAYDLYDEKMRLAYDVEYLKKKYFADKKMVLMYNVGDTIDTANESILKAMHVAVHKYSPSTQLIPTSFIFYYRQRQGIYNYTTFIEFFINLYNSLIQLSTSSNTYCIRMQSDYYLELIFDMIDILRYYFKRVVLVRTKYDTRYNFFLVLENKIQSYDKRHNIHCKPDQYPYRLQKSPINPVYIDYMNKLYKDYASRIKIVMSIKKLNKDYRHLIKERIKFYQRSFAINFNQRYLSN